MRRLALLLVLMSLCLAHAWAQQPTNTAQYGGNTAAASGVNGLQPVGGYSSQNTSDAAWTSATTLNTRVTQISNVGAYNSILVTLVQGTTITGGVVTFQESNDNTNWVNVQCVNVTTMAIVGSTYTLVASTNVNFLCPLNTPYFGVLLSTAITGSGTVTVGHNALTSPNVGLLAGNQSLAAGANLVGAVNLDVGGSAVSASIPVPVSATAAANTKTNPLFDAPSDGTNQITAAISALGTAPTGTEVETVNDVHLPTTASGAAVSASSLTASITTTGTNVKASAGNLYGVFAINGIASVCWVQFVNSATGGTLGTASIVSFPLPASTTQPIWIPLTYPVNFSTGIAVGVSTTAGGATACGTTGASITVIYK